MIQSGDWRSRQSDIIRDLARRAPKPEREPELSYGAMATALLSLAWAERLLMEKPGNHAAAVAATRECIKRIGPHIPDYLERP